MMVLIVNGTRKEFFFPFTKNCFAFKFSNEKILQGVKKNKKQRRTKNRTLQGVIRSRSRLFLDVKNRIEYKSNVNGSTELLRHSLLDLAMPSV